MWRHSKRTVAQPHPALTEDLLRLKRRDLKAIVGLLTGFAPLRFHLNRTGVTQQTTLCRLCEEADETATHIIYECPALTARRHNLFGAQTPMRGIPRENLVRNLTTLIKGLGLLPD